MLVEAMASLSAASQPQGAILVDELVREIHARIMSGEFPVGSWLRQEALAADFKVSRTPVREALRQLQSAELLQLFPHRGALVRGPRAKEVLDAYVVCANLEGLAAEIAAARLSPTDLDTLVAAEREFERSASEVMQRYAARPSEPVESHEWLRANDQFHGVVHQGADNERLVRVATDLRRTFPRHLTSRPLMEDPFLVKEDLAEHRRIREALERRDPEASRRAMTDHVLRAGKLVAAWFERQERT